MGLKKIVTEARALLAKGWCKGTFARDINGECVYHGFPNAVAFCSLGAIARAQGDANFGRRAGQVPREFYSAFEKVSGTQDVVWFNDHKCRSQEEIVDVFDKVIALID
jgi:hypothetical protein